MANKMRVAQCRCRGLQIVERPIPEPPPNGCESSAGVWRVSQRFAHEEAIGRIQYPRVPGTSHRVIDALGERVSQ